MPRLTNDSLTQHNLPTGAHGYSAVRMDELGAAEYTLVTIVQDISGSVHSYKKEMEATLQEIIKACKLSPRADFLMIRLVLFNDRLDEAHGFKLLEQCNPDEYDGILQPGGLTALFDATENAISATADYGKQLVDQDFSVNAIVFVITDGCNNDSTLTANDVKKALAKVVKSEQLESVVSVLIGVRMQDDPEAEKALDEFHKKAGMTQFVPIVDANIKTLAKLAEFISKSISAQSQALGTGSASQPLNLTI